MNKMEKKIQVIKQMLGACITSGADAFAYGNIPTKRFLGARKKYAFDAKYDDVIALVDTTISGNGERGLLITTHDIYLKELLSSPIHCKLGNLNNFVFPNGVYYDIGNLHAMLVKLQEIENEPENQGWNVVGRMVSSALQEGFKVIKEEYQKQLMAEEQETIEELEEARDFIIIIRDDFIDSLVQEDDDLSPVGATVHIMHITALSYLFVNSYEKYEKIWVDDINEILNNDDIIKEAEIAKQIVEVMPEMVEYFNEVIEDFCEEDVEPIDRTFKRFNSTMVRIYEEMKEEIENDNIEQDEIEEYFNESQNAIKVFKKKINIIIKLLNRKIEDLYND